MIFALKIKKNSRILHDIYPKMHYFYMIIAQKYFFQIFFEGRGACAQTPPPNPRLLRQWERSFAVFGIVAFIAALQARIRGRAERDGRTVAPTGGQGWAPLGYSGSCKHVGIRRMFSI